ncbi:hypothetical protein [Paucibacter sp. KBW04]|uniref:hypothetical protein n=1 Tax=Paucibacter sp. KBW04 TaxID=2153361 RepID=UPI000F58E867|nr:hypothetical protein [Paucibacter sp. KBW04]
MSKLGQRRWLLVAKRAAEIKAMLDAQHLAGARLLSQQADRAWADAKGTNEQVQQQWRTWLERESFHAADEALFRGYQSQTRKVEFESRSMAIEADRLFNEAQLQARRSLGEKRALATAVRRALLQSDSADVKASQVDADEIWQVLSSDEHEVGS